MPTSVGPSLGRASRRANVLLDEAVAKLERELRSRQQQLVEETARNTRAKAQLVLLSALARANDAITELLAAEAAGDVNAPATQPAIDALEAEMAALVFTFEDASCGASPPPSAACGDAGEGGAPPGGGGGAQRPGLGECAPAESGAAFSSCSAVGSFAHSSTRPTRGGAAADARGEGRGDDALIASRMGLITASSVGTLLREIIGGRHLVGSKAEFISFWRRRVMQLALLAHQYRNGAIGRDALEKIVYEMAVKFGALFLYGSYILEVIVLDLETGVVCEPPQNLWDRVAATLALNPDQAMMFAVLNRWWKSTTQASQHEREELTRRALESPTDLELQEAVVSGIERANAAYLAAAVAVLAVTLYGVTRPEQVAGSWISCWPRMPLMTAIFEACERQRSLG